MLGALVAVGFYRFVKVLEYETANPGADFNEKEAEVFEFDEDNAARAEDVARPNIALTPSAADSQRVMSRDSQQIPGSGSRLGSSQSGGKQFGDLTAFTNGPVAEEGRVGRDSREVATSPAPAR